MQATPKWLQSGIQEVHRLTLRSGPVRMIFEPDSGFLRYVSVGEQELLRGVYAAVRDQNWGTVEPKIGDVEVDRGEDHFRVEFRADCRQGDIDFRWKGTLTGEESGNVTFSFRGTAHSDFRSNRIGFCVLHPVTLAGHPCRIERVDGTIVEGEFPQLISPHQPFKKIRTIYHQLSSGAEVAVRMTGETFEMEDQRNWTDASYKTYCRPLELPFPFEVRSGDLFEQEVSLKLSGEMPGGADEAEAEKRIFLSLGEIGPSLPPIGLGWRSHDEEATEEEAEKLRDLDLPHVRLELDLGTDFTSLLEQADREIARIGSRLELAIHLEDGDEESQLDNLRGTLKSLKSAPTRILVFHEGEKSTDARWVELARRTLAGSLSRVPIGGGTDAFFAELNRGRPNPDPLDFLCYSVNPQVHAFDEASLAETIEAQGMTVETAEAFSRGKSIVVSPVTLRPRFNPNATGPEPKPAPGELPSQVDPRQTSLFAAAWTAASIGALSESGVDSLTFYETTGWRGVLERASGSPLPEKFPSEAGMVFPLYHVFRDLASLEGARIFRTRSSAPLEVRLLALERQGALRILIANLEGESKRLVLRGVKPARYRRRSLDEDSGARACRRPEDFRNQTGEEFEIGEKGEAELTIPPHAVLTLDSI